MKTIEGFLDSRPLLKSLSLDQLPNTSRPLCIKRSMSKMSGHINGLGRTRMDSTSWLFTDKVQFLFAFLLRNQDNNSGVVHVLGPMITHKVGLVYELMPAILEDKATVTEHDCYLSTLADIQKYIDTRLDIFEHKFLVFALNINNTHWLSVVVVNPFLVFDQYLSEGKDNCAERKNKAKDEFCGWCILNSTARHDEREQNGLQGTRHTRNNPAYGVRLFLNVCASYLKHKKENKGD